MGGNTGWNTGREYWLGILGGNTGRDSSLLCLMCFISSATPVEG